MWSRGIYITSPPRAGKNIQISPLGEKLKKKKRGKKKRKKRKKRGKKRKKKKKKKEEKMGIGII